MHTSQAIKSVLRRPLIWVFAAVLALAVFSGGGGTFGSHRASIPFPSLIYKIEATSNGHTASILNLKIGYLGTLQAPIPVDVDGDLIPDVLVSVNLVDTQGLHNPPQVGDIIRPNVEINRYPTDLVNVLLGKPSPPLRIDVAFTINDLQNQQPPMTARFGYDTAGGGSIPAYFQATVDGLTNFFNPVTATISTKGAIITQSTSPLWYRGPLTVIGGFNQGTFNADLGLKYSPFPDQAVFTYAHDAQGNHIDYSHDYPGDVDLLTTGTITDGASRTNVSALVQHLPRKIGLDLTSDANGGGIHYDSTADGRLPDVDVTYRGPLAGDIYNAHLNIEQLPSTMDAHWSMPSNGPMSASFDSSGQGIGAIEANITNKDGNPQGLPPFVYNEKQTLAIQDNSATGGLRIGGRIERIRHLDVAQKAGGGFVGTANVGDGELPLQLAAFLDLRSTGAPLIDANATLSPLPSGPQPGHPTFELTPAGADQKANPLTFAYSSLESVDIDGHVLVRDSKAPAVAAPADVATCGTTGVLCGDLRIRNIPTSITAKIGEFKNADNGKREMHVDVDSDGPGHIDVFADVKVGPDIVPNGTPISGRPLAAHVELLGIAKHERIRTVEGQDDTLQRAEFHTCDYSYTTERCTAATKDDQIGALQFALSNFLVEHRNDPDVQVPSAYAATPNYATITARGHNNGGSVAFEATGRVQSIRELTYVNDGAFGIRTNVGDNQPLSALVDIKDIALDDSHGVHRVNHIYDVNADVLIKPLPQKMSFCFNESGQEIVAPTSSITAPCQDKNPFSTALNKTALAKSPLSISYDGKDGNDNPQQIDEIVVNGQLVDKGALASVSDDRTIKGHVDITNIPATIRAHLLDPKDQGSGPMKLLVEAPVLGPQLKVVASAAMLDADLQCQDPRVPATGKSALCATATLDNVPTRVTMDYDPTVKHDNFVLDTAGDKQMDVTGLSVSSVARDDATGLAKVLIGEGSILGLPKNVKGTLVTPAPDEPNDPVVIDLTATPELGSIDATVRNFIAPDPIPDMAAQRAGLPDPTDYASFIQRGDAFKGVVHITEVKRVGFQNQVDATGKKLDTNIVNVDFGADKIIRGFVDLDPDGTNQILGDVTLTDVPAGLQLCFRGPKKDENKGILAANPTFCDQQPRAAGDNSDPSTIGNADTQALSTKVGAFEARMSPVDGPKKLDVHAFVRSAQGGGADILAGKVDVTDIPNVIRGTFGDGKVDVGGFTLAGVPDGIAEIAAHAASFDIPDDGWNIFNRPYQPRTVSRAPFPAPASSNEFASLRADDTDFEARAHIGPQSQLHRIQVADTPCAKPVGVDYGSGAADYGARPDFPFFPTADGSKYTCIRGDFKSSDANPDPLDLSVVVHKGDQVLSLDNAQLSDIPSFFQVNLADTNPLDTPDKDPDHQLRQTCVGQGQTQPANCVAPLVRFDDPGGATLSGVASLGTPADLASLLAIQPREDLPPDLTTTDTWDHDGIRARIGSFKSSTAVRAGFRIPIPASVTVDQVGTWSMQDLSNQANYRDASDLHFRFAARDSAGTTFDNLGFLSAFVHSFTDGSQVLLSSDDPNQGVPIPGELGIDLYTRNHDGNGRNFIQIDGRSSANNLNIRARMLGTGGSAIGRLDAQIRDVPPMASLAYAPNDDPSFRIRAEVMGSGKAPPDSAGSDPASQGDPPKEDDCSPLLCVVTQVRVKTVNVQFDFKPDNAPDYARLLEAAIHTDGASNGVEIRGNANIDGSGAPARFLAGAQIVIDPLNVFVHAGIPLLASFDLINIASLDAAFSLGGDFGPASLWLPGEFQSSGNDIPTLSGEGTSDFAMRQNLVHITASNAGPDHSIIGPIDYNVTVLHGEAWALFIKLIGVDFVPEPSTLRMPFFDCQNPLDVISNLDGFFEVPGGGTASVVAWPFGTPPIIYSGLLGGIGTLFGALARPFFCLASTDQTLISDSATDPHPADPLGVGVTGSVVPDAKVNAITVVTTPPPPPSPVLEDYQASSTVPLCGTFTFASLTVPNGVTLHVADTPNSLDIHGNADVASDNVPAACSAAATPHELTIIADHNVTVSGTIDAHAQVNGTNASGNSGGGHGAGLFPFIGSGDGGDGGRSGTGGQRFGDLFDALTTEQGRAGSADGSAGAGAAGAGGGVITIVADVLTVNGTGVITADGDPGQAGATASNDCAVVDDPGTAADETKANSGKAGGGGGSGGGIVLNVADFENGGSVHADGGNGGDGNAGAGGGGGGGNVKLSTALWSGPGPSASGGAAGADACGDFGTAGSGQGGNLVENQSPKSRVDISGIKDFGFWHSTQGTKSLTLPYSAASASGTGDMTVLLCATEKPTNLPQATDISLSQVLMPATPSSVDIDHPCGQLPADAEPSHIISQPQLIDRHYLQNTNRVDPPSATFDLGDLPEAYYGFYTVVWRSSDNNNDCFDWVDLINAGQIFPGIAERLHDQGVCSEPEAMPSTPDIVVGIDNTNPNIRAFSVHGTAVRDANGVPVVPNPQPVPSNTGNVQLVWNDDDNLSAITARDCTSDFAAVTPSFGTCVSGQNVQVSAGDGTKTIAVRLTDAAGNEDTFSADVLVDTQAPDTSGHAVTLADRANGWYSTSPSFVLNGFDDHGGTGAGDPAYLFQLDEGDVKPCTGVGAPPTCTIDGSPGKELPGLGRHTLHWTGVDKVGNQNERLEFNFPPFPPFVIDERPSVQVKIDGQPPTSALLSVPAAPNGANGWYSGPTWVTFGAFDQPGGSGFAQAADDPTKVSGVSFTVLHNGVTTPHTFDPQHPVPFQLDPGASTVCWSAQDQAGNAEPANAFTHCRGFNVDMADPSALPTPGGSSTWSTSSVPVGIAVTDGGTAGSGVAASGDPSSLCTPAPLIASPAPSGTCISIDGSPFVTTTHDKDIWTLGEGLHQVRTFATDVAGRRSPIRTELYRVDLSDPVAVARVLPAQPANGKWWRATPTIVLRAADGDQHGSGLASIKYKINGVTSTTTYSGPCSATACTYTAPFTLPEGIYRITYWALDNAGRKQADQVLHVAVDTTTPVATATSPNPAIWLRSKLGLPLTSPTVQLRWTLQENLSSRADVDNAPPDSVHVQVVVYDAMAFPVRTLDAGQITVAPGQTYQGSTTWDGKGANLAALLPVGTYYYRVVATDAAGNQTMSGESQKLLIQLSLL